MEHTERLGALANYSAEQLADKCFTNVRTARRWRRAGVAPMVAVRWMWLLLDGALGTISAAWDGWFIRRGELHHPDGWTWTPAELSAVPLRAQEASSLRVECRVLREQLATVTQQYADLLHLRTQQETRRLYAEMREHLSAALATLARLNDATASSESVAFFDAARGRATLSHDDAPSAAFSSRPASQPSAQ